jgi:hypothetical protein
MLEYIYFFPYVPKPFLGPSMLLDCTIQCLHAQFDFCVTYMASSFLLFKACQFSLIIGIRYTYTYLLIYCRCFHVNYSGYSITCRRALQHKTRNKYYKKHVCYRALCEGVDSVFFFFQTTHWAIQIYLFMSMCMHIQQIPGENNVHCPFLLPTYLSFITCQVASFGQAE